MPWPLTIEPAKRFEQNTAPTLGVTPRFSQLNYRQTGQSFNRSLKSDFFSKDRNFLGNSMSDVIGRTNMIYGKYLPEQVVTAATGVRFWETLFRNALTWTASVIMTATVKNDKLSMNSLLFDPFMREQKKIDPINKNANIFQKAQHGVKKWVNSLGLKGGNYFEVLEACNFIHKVPTDQRKIGRSYWRKVMDGNLVELLKSFDAELPKEVKTVETAGRQLANIAGELKQFSKVQNTDIKMLETMAHSLENKGDNLVAITDDIEKIILKYQLGKKGPGGVIDNATKLDATEAKKLQSLKEVMLKLRKIKSKNWTHQARKDYRPFIKKMLKRINLFSILSTVSLTVINTAFGIFSFWLTFKYFAKLDKEFDPKKYELATQKKKRKQHFETLLNQKPVKRLPARLVVKPDYNFGVKQTGQVLNNGKLITPFNKKERSVV